MIEADAREIGRVLDGQQIGSLAAVVSSLPIKWFDLAGQRAIVNACFARMPAEGVFLQLTNALVSPLPTRALGLEGVRGGASVEPCPAGPDLALSPRHAGVTWDAVSGLHRFRSGSRYFSSANSIQFGFLPIACCLTGSSEPFGRIT